MGIKAESTYMLFRGQYTNHSSIVSKNKKTHVSCEFNRSVDTRLSLHGLGFPRLLGFSKTQRSGGLSAIFFTKVKKKN